MKNIIEKIVAILTRQKRLREQLLFFSQMVNTDIRWLSPAYPNLVSMCYQIMSVYRICESIHCNKNKMRAQLNYFLSEYEKQELTIQEKMLISRYTYMLENNWETFRIEDISSFRIRLNEVNKTNF